MPAGIAILTVWNIITVVLMVVGGGGGEKETFLFMAAIGCLIGIFLIAHIFRALPKAAAAE